MKIKKLIQTLVATLTLGKWKGKVKKAKSYMEDSERGWAFPKSTLDNANIFNWRNDTKSKAGTPK